MTYKSYFSHDSNARNSDKLLPVRMKYGAEGYGIFFMLIERLREEKDYMSVKDYNMLAFDLRVDSSILKSIIEDFGLFVFTEDGKYFYSEGFKERMELMDTKSKKLSEAGKKGAKKRWSNNDNMTDLKQPYSHAIANAKENDSNKTKLNKTKPNKNKKDKESERHKYGAYENVLFSDDELNKLKSEFPNDWEARVERVSEYCASSGKSYKNYLATIRNWAKKEMNNPLHQNKSIKETNSIIHFGQEAQQ